MLIMYVRHTVKRTSLCSCMRVVRNFVWIVDGCGLHEVILWFLGVIEQICIGPPLEYQVFARCGSGYQWNKRYELPNLLILYFFFILLYDLCNDAVPVSCSDCIVSNGRIMVNHELERIWKWLWPDLSYCLPRTEKNEKPGRVGTVCVTSETVTS